MRRLHCLIALPFCAAVTAQEPVLHAAEIAAYQAVRKWHAQFDGGEPLTDLWVEGYDTVFFGYDKNDEPKVSQKFDLSRDWASVVVLSPSRDAVIRYRPLMAISLGHVFVGQPPADDENWSPSVATVSGHGVNEDLANMLLQSGRAADGTRWQRVETLERDVRQRQSIRFVRDDGGTFQKFEFTIGSPRFRWHPAWLPLAEGTALAQRGAVVPGRVGEGSFAGLGIAARGLHLRLQTWTGKRGRISVRTHETAALLDAGSVRTVDGELVITLPTDAMVECSRLDDQAWAAEAMRRLAEFQLAARRAGTIDRDGDGAGEFGDPDEVVPRSQRRYQRLPGGRFLFEGHLFEVHFGRTADERERKFVAYAWPATAGHGHDLVFAVDERNVVFAASADGLFDGHDRAPLADAIADRTLRWRVVFR